MKKLKTLYKTNFQITPYIEQNIDHENLYRGRIISIFVIILLSLALASLPFLGGAGLGYRDVTPRWIEHHTIAYGIFLIASIILFLFSRSYLQGRFYSHRTIAFVVYGYAFIACAFGVYVSSMNYLVGNGPFTMVTMLIGISCLLYLKPLYVVTLLLLTSGSFFVVEVSRGQLTYSDFLNLSILTSVLMIATLLRFRAKVRITAVEEEQLNTNRRLQTASMVDSLTGLKNRYALRKDFEQYIHCHLHVMMMDIDDFKFYNDHFGHAVGDKILNAFGKLIAETFRGGSAYRYGGDEFMVVLVDVSEDDFHSMIHDWEHNYHGVMVGGEVVKPSFSGGYVYGYSNNNDSVRKMLRQADSCLYEAKNAGKDRIKGMPYDENVEDEIFAHQDRTSEKTDELTGLDNMMQFRNHAKILIDRQTYQPGECAIVYFDLENFKMVNERLGFGEGDKLLVIVADLIKKNFNDGLSARFAEDHFVVMTKVDGLEKKILEMADTLSDYKGIPLHLKAGIYVYDGGKFAIANVCDEARLACGSIKRQNAVCFRYYDEALKFEKRRENYVIEHLDEAIEKGYIKPYYQPVVRVLTGKYCAYEALARWEDPVHGMLTPDVFIPILEKAQLIHKLDLYIMACICHDQHDLMTMGLRCLPCSINISPIDFSLCDMADELSRIRRKNDVPRKLIAVELSKSTESDDQSHMRRALKDLRSEGFTVWLEDFDGSHETIGLLSEHLFNVVKIGSRYIAGIKGETNYAAVIENLSSMLKELNVSPLAEGVETAAQWELLKKSGYVFAQGYYFSEPLPIGDILKRLQTDGDLTETLAEGEYYDAIGKVDVMKPVWNIQKETGVKQNVFGIAIAEYNRGELKAVIPHRIFNALAEDLNIQNVNGVYQVPEGEKRESYDRLIDVINRCIESGKWEDELFDIGKTFYGVFVKPIVKGDDERFAIEMILADFVHSNTETNDDESIDLEGYDEDGDPNHWKREYQNRVKTVKNAIGRDDYY